MKINRLRNIFNSRSRLRDVIIDKTEVLSRFTTTSSNINSTYIGMFRVMIGVEHDDFSFLETAMLVPWN